MSSVLRQLNEVGQAGSSSVPFGRGLFRRCCAYFVIATAGACTSDLVTSPPQPLQRSPATVGMGGLPAAQPGDSAKADSLAVGLARTLAQPEFRKMVFTDLRDSPFHRHAIDLTTYLQAAHAHALVAAIARNLEVRADAVLAMAMVRGGLELLLPITRDRAEWTGTDNIVVTGAAYTVNEDLLVGRHPFAYTLAGRTVAVPFDQSLPSALLSVEPRTYTFGPDPEGVRANAPRHSRATVSTFAEERRENYELTRQRNLLRFDDVPCNTTVSIQADTPCDVSAGSGPFGVYLPSGSTFTDCVPNAGSPIPDPSVDADQDGVSDACEYELAQAFHPQMQFMQGDCDTGREPYWAVNYEISPIDGSQVVDIFYAIGYHEDCGTAGFTFHYGDSEFIVEEVGTVGYPTYNGGHWYLRYVTYSAHYGTPEESSGTYSGGDVEYANAAPGSNPVSWVSEGKHGNYRSQAACDAGGFFGSDNCDHPGERVGLDIFSNANLGSHVQPIVDVVGSREGGFFTGIEHMWSTTNVNGLGFLGWYPRSFGNGETPYGALLRNYGF
jgi:hypothetical protein